MLKIADLVMARFHDQIGFVDVRHCGRADIAVALRVLKLMLDMVNGILATALYLPSGNPRPGPKFGYKLAWFGARLAHAEALFATKAPVVLAGDFSVMPTDLDVYKPERWLDDALFAPEVRAAFAQLLEQGWTGALRSLHPGERIYAFMDYFRNVYPPRRRVARPLVTQSARREAIEPRRGRSRGPVLGEEQRSSAGVD